jgi:hypothetical protein
MDRMPHHQFPDWLRERHLFRPGKMVLFRKPPFSKRHRRNRQLVKNGRDGKSERQRVRVGLKIPATIVYARKVHPVELIHQVACHHVRNPGCAPNPQNRQFAHFLELLVELQLIPRGIKQPA